MKNASTDIESKRSKLRDVAREAGVSVATVSRVINNSPRVTEKTKLKINEVISRLGYAPNPVARALTVGRTKTIGAVIPTLDHAIFANFLSAVEEALAASKYRLVVATTGGDPDVELERTQALFDMGVEGIVLSGTVHRAEIDQLSSRYEAPVVLTSCYDERASYPTIGYDNFHLAQLAMKHLFDLGHRGICVIHGPLKNNDRTRARLAGAREFSSEVELTAIETELSEAGGSEAVGKILKEKPRPTALLCLSDVIALGALFELQRASLKVPDDISVMGFDNLNWSVHAEPALTSISLPVRRMGKKTAEALVRKLEDDVDIESVLIGGSLVERASTARPPH
ncbi:LacI family DNA-binding transcriptional regulator [Hoeflea sp. TYP-13]|uniref:LacI family DNA-binding transcriptional regulator n=1 Tax=Hoeflea sp. TYP-13 TaxID=3230023 RepID=UPI0034C697DF